MPIWDSPWLVPVLTLMVAVAGTLAEFFSIPKSRKQLDIPRWDWLTFSLGFLPGLGVWSVTILQFLFPTINNRPELIVPGFILSAGCVAIRTYSKIVLGRYYTFAITLTDDHKVMKDGPYRFVRHPLYLGAFMGAVGFPLMTQSWAAVFLLSLPVAFVYGLRLYKEEAYLLKNLGPEYQDYARSTARLVPFIW